MLWLLLFISGNNTEFALYRLAFVHRTTWLGRFLPASDRNPAIYPPGPHAKYQGEANNHAHKGEKCDHTNDHRYGDRQRANHYHEQIRQRIAGRELSVFAVLIQVIDSRLLGAFSPI